MVRTLTAAKTVWEKSGLDGFDKKADGVEVDCSLRVPKCQLPGKVAKRLEQEKAPKYALFRGRGISTSSPTLRDWKKRPLGGRWMFLGGEVGKRCVCSVLRKREKVLRATDRSRRSQGQGTCEESGITVQRKKWNWRLREDSLIFFRKGKKS